MRTQRGFTLIELLVVIAIIGILATLVITQLAGAQARARNSNAKSDISEAGKAVETWKTTADTEFIPDSMTITAGLTGTNIRLVGTTQTPSASWTAFFDQATGAFPVRINKVPSTSHTYGYGTNTADGTPTFAERLSTNYCVGTSVSTSTSAPDGAFFIQDGVSVNKAVGSNTMTYSNDSTPCE